MKRKERIAAFGKDILQLEWPTLTARFNIAPTQEVPIAVLFQDSYVIPTTKRWKVPPNARVETLTSKPAWARSVQKRRCLIPADGFYEWRKVSEKLREPFHFQLTDGAPFFFAGIFDTEYVIITTTPNEVIRPIHDRMPVILDADAAHAWLKPGDITVSAIAAICRPYPAERMEAWPVHKLVGNPRNDGPECVAPWKPEPDDSLLPGFDLNSA